MESFAADFDFSFIFNYLFNYFCDVHDLAESAIQGYRSEEMLPHNYIFIYLIMVRSDQDTGLGEDLSGPQGSIYFFIYFLIGSVLNIDLWAYLSGGVSSTVLRTLQFQVLDTSQGNKKPRAVYRDFSFINLTRLNQTLLSLTILYYLSSNFIIFNQMNNYYFYLFYCNRLSKVSWLIYIATSRYR